MKIVVGLPGDRVRVTDQGIRINEKLLLHSRPLRRSFLPRPQPTTVGPHEAWVWSPVPGSVDSRYLGTVRPLAVVAPMGSIRAEDQKLMVPTLRNE
jgi:type IV secretory pathway protease TraF